MKNLSFIFLLFEYKTFDLVFIYVFYILYSLNICVKDSNLYEWTWKNMEENASKDAQYWRLLCDDESKKTDGICQMKDWVGALLNSSQTTAIILETWHI